MCEKAITKEPSLLKHVPDQFKTREMCNDVMKHQACMLKSMYQKDLKTQRNVYQGRGTCMHRYVHEYVSDRFKTQEMRQKAVAKLDTELLLEHIPYRFQDSRKCVKKLFVIKPNGV